MKERGHGGPLGRFFFFHVLRFIYKLGMWSIWQRIAVSKRTEAALEAEFYPPVDVVEFGLEPEAFAVQAPAERPEGEPVRFVFCGRLTPIKQVEKAMEALLALRQGGASFHFDIIGEGSERVALEKKVEAAKAGEAFTFHGELSESVKRGGAGAQRGVYSEFTAGGIFHCDPGGDGAGMLRGGGERSATAERRARFCGWMASRGWWWRPGWHRCGMRWSGCCMNRRCDCVYGRRRGMRRDVI